ncbi:MAG: hypothetical protein ABSA12_02705 [Verrucomicrobiia bacterium]|jgi:hypothetical protein
MSTPSVKSELKSIAAQLPDSATYSDAMYELYVRMKIAAGRKAAAEGRVISHAAVKRRFARR